MGTEETPRFAIRPIENGDKSMILTWRNSEAVAPYMYSNHKISPEEHDAWFEGALAQSGRRDWIIVFEGSPVGLASIYGINAESRFASWAFYLASDSVRGKGAGSFVEVKMLDEAFNSLGLNRLCCEVLEFNQSVVKMHKRFGFTEEGILRKHRFKDGEFHDVHVLGIMRDEWLEHRKELVPKLQKRDLE